MEESFDKDLTPGSVKSAMNSLQASSADLWKVNPSSLRVIEGFNARVKNQKYLDRVAYLVRSIKENGFYVDKPLTGYAAKEDGQDVIYITGGHRRHEAVLIAIAEGAEITHVPVIVKPKGTSLEDLTVDLIVGNDGEPLTTLEQGYVCARLVSYGWDIPKIAQKLGYQSNVPIGNMLTLAAAPRSIRDHVSADRISASLAIELIHKHQDKAAGVIDRLVAKAAKGKVTAKDIPENRFKQVLKKNAPALFGAIKEIRKDAGYQYLSLENQRLLDRVLKEVNEPISD